MEIVQPSDSFVPPADSITGLGTPTEVAFFDATHDITSDSNLYWDNVDKFLGVGTTTPESKIHAVESTGITVSPPTSVTSFLTIDTAINSPTSASASQLIGPEQPTGFTSSIDQYIDAVQDNGINTNQNTGESGYIASAQNISYTIYAYRLINSTYVVNPNTQPASFSDTLNDGTPFGVDLGGWSTINGYEDGFLLSATSDQVGVTYTVDIGNVTSYSDLGIAEGTFGDQAFDTAQYNSTGGTYNQTLYQYRIYPIGTYNSSPDLNTTGDGGIGGNTYVTFISTWSAAVNNGFQYENANSVFFNVGTSTGPFYDWGQITGIGGNFPEFTDIAFGYFDQSGASDGSFSNATQNDGSGSFTATGATYNYYIWEYKVNPVNGLKYVTTGYGFSVMDNGDSSTFTWGVDLNPGTGNGIIWENTDYGGGGDIGGGTHFDDDGAQPPAPDTSNVLGSYSGTTRSYSVYGYVTSPALKYSSTHFDYPFTDTNPVQGYIISHTYSGFGNATNIKDIEETTSPYYRGPGSWLSTVIGSPYIQTNTTLGDVTVTPSTLGFNSTGQTYTYDVSSTEDVNGTIIYSSTSTNHSQSFPNDGLSRFVTLTIANTISGAVFRIHKISFGFEDTLGIFSGNVTYNDTITVPWNGSSTLTPTSYIYAVGIFEKSISSINDPAFVILRNTNNLLTNSGIAFQHGSSTFPTNDATIQINSSGGMVFTSNNSVYVMNLSNGSIMNSFGPTQIVLNSPHSGFEVIMYSNTSGQPLLYANAASGTRFFGINHNSTSPITGVIFSVDDRNTTNNINAYLTGTGTGNYITATGKISNHDFTVDNFGRISAGTTQQTTAGLAVGNQSSSTAAMRLIPGTVVSSIISGNIENDGSHLYYTTSVPARRYLLQSGTSSALTNNFLPVANSVGDLVDSHWQDSGSLLIASLQIEAKQGLSLDSGQNISMGSGSVISGGIRWTYVAKTANYTLNANDHVVNATSGTFNFTNPTAVGINGREYITINSGTGVATLLFTSGQNLNGLTSIALSQRQGLKYYSDGANYISPGVLAGSIVGSIAGSQITGSALTKTDDTNVTLTLGGSPTTALVNAASLTLGWAGTLAVSRGGIGAGTQTAHGVLLGQGTSAITATAVGATGTVLHGNTGADPTYSAVSLTADVSGILPVANGGTGSSTLLGGGISTVTNVQLTNQGADIGTTNLATVAGLYRVNYSLQDTTADITAGAAILTLSYTDGAGATTTTATQVLTGLGRTSGSVYVQLASGNLTYAVSHTGLYGSAKYALFITTERYI